MRFSHPLLVLCICACVRVYTGIYHVLEVCAHMCNVLETMCPNRVLQVCVLHVAGVCVCACVCVCVCRDTYGVWWPHGVCICVWCRLSWSLMPLVLGSL
jgi:hypothetical protein